MGLCGSCSSDADASTPGRGVYESDVSVQDALGRKRM